ncbi:MAG: two-component sensor histidine kinase, partial [Pseudomonas aeruginosa]|nr:two-component sensor histidine kinase [Pseudomonas aeruginosa]
MRSLFWRILAAFWLALLLVAGLSILLGRALNQDTWIIARHPGLKDLAEQWTALYEEQGSYAAQGLLEQRRRDYGISIQVLDESGQRLVDGTYLPRPHHRPPRTSDRNLPRFPWRQLS